MSPYFRFAPSAAVILLLVNLGMLFWEVVVGGAGLTAAMFSMFMKISTGMADEFRTVAKISSIVALVGWVAAIPTFCMAAFYFRELRRPSQPNPPLGWWCVSIVFHGVAMWFAICFVPGTMRVAGAEFPNWVFNAVGVLVSIAMVVMCRVKPSSTIEVVED